MPESTINSEIQFKKLLGGKIRTIREAKRMTQEQLGEKLGYSGRMVSKFENATDHLKIGTLFHIADALEVPLYALIPFQFLTDGLPYQDFLTNFASLDEDDRSTVNIFIRSLKEKRERNFAERPETSG